MSVDGQNSGPAENMEQSSHPRPAFFPEKSIADSARRHHRQEQRPLASQKIPAESSSLPPLPWPESHPVPNVVAEKALQNKNQENSSEYQRRHFFVLREFERGKWKSEKSRKLFFEPEIREIDFRKTRSRIPISIRTSENLFRKIPA